MNSVLNFLKYIYIKVVHLYLRYDTRTVFELHTPNLLILTKLKPDCSRILTTMETIQAACIAYK